jgi:hypothetical protein
MIHRPHHYQSPFFRSLAQALALSTTRHYLGSTKPFRINHYIRLIVQLLCTRDFHGVCEDHRGSGWIIECIQELRLLLSWERTSFAFSNVYMLSFWIRFLFSLSISCLSFRYPGLTPRALTTSTFLLSDLPYSLPHSYLGVMLHARWAFSSLSVVDIYNGRTCKVGIKR